MVRIIRDFLHETIIEQFGFTSVMDLLNTLAKFHYLKVSVLVSLTMTTFHQLWKFFSTELIGLEPEMLIAFVFLICAEFFTGLRVSISKGDRFRSRKMGRMIVKIGVYLSILWVARSYSNMELAFGDTM